MPINLSIPENTELAPRITVVGVGGAGGNAVNNMINAELEGVDFVVCNTDAQAISQSRAERRVQLGAAVTQGWVLARSPKSAAPPRKKRPMSCWSISRAATWCS